MDKSKRQIQACCNRIGLVYILCSLLCATSLYAKDRSIHSDGNKLPRAEDGALTDHSSIHPAEGGALTDQGSLAHLALSAMEATLSGEYVWYADYTFKRKSYIGFLYYNENTLAMRYWSPQDAKAGLVEKEVDVYVTMKDGALTGERVIGGDGEESVTIVNYLHDLFYDLSSVSSSIGAIAPFSKASKEKELAAFRADVVIEVNSFIPVFGVRYVRGEDNKVLLEAVTVGTLTSSDDTSFSDFKGLPETSAGKGAGGTVKSSNGSIRSATHQSTADKKDKGKVAKKIKRGKKVNVAITAPRYAASRHGSTGLTNHSGTTAQGDRDASLHFSIDDGWKQTMDNMWLLGDEAMITAAEIGELQEEDIARYTRRLIQSTGTDYIDWRTFNLEERHSADAPVSINTVTVQSDGDRVMTFRRLQKAGGEEGRWYLFTLTVFSVTYQLNRTYFDAIKASVDSK